jgi:co-chaperonin GroES (HSP10)
MEQRLLKTGTAEYTMVEWNGRNESGFEPFSNRVLILVDQVAAQTKGGIIIVNEIQEKQNAASESGVIVAMGTEAFQRDDDGRPWVGAKPEVGKHVFFERYAGQVLHGADARMYRLMDARCIGAMAIALPDDFEPPEVQFVKSAPRDLLGAVAKNVAGSAS